MKHGLLAIIIGLTLSMSAFAQTEPAVATSAVESAEAGPVMATAVIRGTAPDSPIFGIASLQETAEGLQVVVDIQNVPDPGEHGFHIHENGSCDDGGMAAGGHFNPAAVSHGLLPRDGHEHAHAGDMGNVIVQEDGSVNFSIILTDVGLGNAKYDVRGKAIILHDKADDFGQPVGNAGGRIACGIIEVENITD